MSNSTELHKANSQLTGFVELLQSEVAQGEQFQHFHMPEMMLLLGELVERYDNEVATMMEDFNDA